VKPKTRGTADLLVAVTQKSMGLPYRPALDNLSFTFILLLQTSGNAGFFVPAVAFTR